MSLSAEADILLFFKKSLVLENSKFHDELLMQTEQFGSIGVTSALYLGKMELPFVF